MEKLKETVNVFRTKGARRTLILCDKEMLRTGHAHDVINALHAKQMKYSIFSETLSQPVENAVSACMSKMLSEGIDSIIAIGDQELLEVHQSLMDALDPHELVGDFVITNDLV